MATRTRAQTGTQTPEQLADAEWRKTEAARVAAEERHSKERQEYREIALRSGQRAKIRHDVYAELEYPEAGDRKAEAEIARRIGIGPEPEVGYADAMAGAMVEAGVPPADTGPLDAVLAMDDNEETVDGLGSDTKTD